MKLGKGHRQPTPAEWRAIQQSGKDVPSRIDWPQDMCTRCRSRGQMHFETGSPLCDTCAENTVIQRASEVGLHERRMRPQLQA